MTTIQKIIAIFRFISYIRLLPLYLYYRFELKRGCKSAILFRQDLQRQPRYNFFSLMNIQYQRNIFYIRFKPWGHVFRLIAPRDSTISSTSTIGGGLSFVIHTTRLSMQSQ